MPTHLEGGMGSGRELLTCKMQGKSEYKTGCGKFKRLGVGSRLTLLWTTAIPTILLPQRACPEEVGLNAGFCAIHAQLLHMFKNLQNEGRQCKMDNLFESILLARAAYSLPTYQG